MKYLEVLEHGLVSIQFLVALNLFLEGKGKILKDALTEVYHNLSLQALSVKETGIKLEFEKITQLATEINLKLQNSIFVNKSRVQKLKFENEIKKKKKKLEFKEEK